MAIHGSIAGIGAVLSGALLAGSVDAAEFIVKEGQPRAEIVIAAKPARMAKLAAEELQAYVAKISGAQLPVTDAPGDALPVKIYVGRSAFTEKLGIDGQGLDDGAFQMKSGANWLVLLGRDDDFVPKEPYTAVGGGSSEPDRLRMLAEWDKRTGTFYGNPRGDLGRQYSRSLKLWAFDESGSFNAVCEFLRRLGVRWYMSGENGEIVPRITDIPLPTVDETVRPAFGLRCMHPMGDTFGSLNRDDLLWTLRLGLNAQCRALGPAMYHSHGLDAVLSRAEMRAAHPEYYAMAADGTRKTNVNHACLTSDGLVAEAARYARAVFDVYGAPSVSVMPEDGFFFCRCEGCKGKDTPERGRAGEHSDYVWAFVDRVAREVIKTHPDRTISCAAYGTYTLPPAKIAKLSPNVQVVIVHGRGWQFPKPVERGLTLSLLDLWKEWRDRTDRPIMDYEHYPLTNRGYEMPLFYFPHAIAAGLRAHRGISPGEFVEVGWGPAQVRGHGLHSPEFAHLNVYVTSRLYWNPDLDLDALLDEYYRLFYGPAAAEMRLFIEYCEANWPEMSKDAVRIQKAQGLYAAARKKAEPGSVYERRLAPLAEYMAPMEALRKRLARGREGTPTGRGLARPGAGITADGRLDEAVWKAAPAIALRQLRNGEAPAVATEFRVVWEGKDKGGMLWFGIRCSEPDMAGLKVTGVRDGDIAMWSGDTVELLLETQCHSYYQLTVDPLGRVIDIDWAGGRKDDWVANAQIATFRGPDFWSVEIGLPVTGEEKPGDPLHDLAGWKPTAAAPWNINIGRSRVRGDKQELSIWSPVGEQGGWHNALKFGKFYVE